VPTLEDLAQQDKYGRVCYGLRTSIQEQPKIVVARCQLVAFSRCAAATLVALSLVRQSGIAGSPEPPTDEGWRKKRVPRGGAKGRRPRIDSTPFGVGNGMNGGKSTSGRCISKSSLAGDTR
jgi:hypothetical protein